MTNRDRISFSAVEQLDEAVQELGWQIEYQQLRKGKFYAGFTFIENNDYYLASEHFNNHLRINCEPPQGYTGFFLPKLNSGQAFAQGQALDPGNILALPSNSDLEVITHESISNNTFFLPEDQFNEAECSLVPTRTLLSPRSAIVLQGNPKVFAAIQNEIDFILQQSFFDAEASSNLLAGIIMWMNESVTVSADDDYSAATSFAVARRAQTYIEENFKHAIILKEVCKFTGVGLRTLQRCFLNNFKISPLNYIKARRLNSARRNLVLADPLEGSVTQIAMNNGFNHLGRFSTDYKIFFGEPPAKTLSMTS